MIEEIERYFEFPVLWETTLSCEGKIIKKAKGLFDYDRSVFCIPRGLMDKLQSSDSWDIISQVGYYQV